MGETIVKIKVSSLGNLHWRELEAVVDTGATYTTIPLSLLESLGVEKSDKVRIEFANGKIEERSVGFIFIEVENKVTANPVIFGEGKGATVLGLVTLESWGFTVDTVNRKLVLLPAIHHYSSVEKFDLNERMLVSYE